MKAKIDTLKMNIKTVLSVRAEVESLQISVNYIKDDIQQLTGATWDIAERLKQVEINDQNDDDYDSEIDMSLFQLKDNLTCESHVKEKGQDLKCGKCDFVGKTDLSIRQHTNTGNPL